MKTKSRIKNLVVISLFSLFPVLLHAQFNDERPDPSGLHTRFSQTPYALSQTQRANDPLITAMVAAINADTLGKTLRELQNWGSRFMMNENRKEIATWLKSKFQSYGYTDVKIDSFYNISSFLYLDSTWQYNVVCTLTGSSAPEEIYVIGGHYDSYCDPDPFTLAPGVDDNGTSVAATLEIARVMANMNYRPHPTIEFTLFAAEELGLFGSFYSAGKARQEGKDIRFMFDIDMVANNPDNLDEVILYKYLNFEWACYRSAQVIEKYTDLSVLIPDNNLNSGSDSYSYWYEGYPSVFFQEITFSPNWHKPSDTVGNCNVPYFAKVTGAVLAALAEQLILPYPQNLTAQSTKEEILLKWKPTRNAFVQGYNIYRSESSGSQYQKISSAPVSDSVYHDLLVEPNRQYYYVLTAVNDSLQESGFSEEVTGVRFNFSDTLLVMANLKGTQVTPDSVIAFYEAVLDTIPFVWYDLNANQKVNISLVSRYRNIFWMSNSPEFEIQDHAAAQTLDAFTANGGNLLFAGFLPLQLWMASTAYPFRIPETVIFRQLFRADSVNRRTQSMMFRANAVASGYDTLNVDPLKYMQPGYPGEIYNIEVYTPLPEASVIYRFDTKYDSTTNLGKMKHKPVGLEYMGSDYKSILLSFPLWYMDTNDARAFLHYVMKEKFIHPVGIEPAGPTEPFSLQVYPNPVTDGCNVAFTIKRSGHVQLSLLSMQGQILDTWIDGNLDPGTHWMYFQMGRRAPGLYQVVLQGKEGSAVRKIIRIQ